MNFSFLSKIEHTRRNDDKLCCFMSKEKAFYFLMKDNEWEKQRKVLRDNQTRLVMFFSLNNEYALWKYFLVLLFHKSFRAITV